MMGETDRNAIHDDASFLEAFFFGSIVAIVPSSFVLLPAVMEGRFSIPEATWVGSWCFAGGFFSSLLIRVGLHLHGFGFLRLVAASPALPVWGLVVFAFLVGVDPDQTYLPIVFVLCGASAAGSMMGYRYRDAWRENLVDSQFWSLVKGPLAGTIICLLMFAGGIVLEENRSNLLPVVIARFLELVVPPILGGMVAGALAAEARPHTSRAFLLPAAMIPAPLFLWAWFFFRRLAGYWADLDPVAVCAATLALCFLGALLGCLHTWWMRRPPKKSVLYSDPGALSLSAEEDDAV